MPLALRVMLAQLLKMMVVEKETAKTTSIRDNEECTRTELVSGTSFKLGDHFPYLLFKHSLQDKSYIRWAFG